MAPTWTPKEERLLTELFREDKPYDATTWQILRIRFILRGGSPNRTARSIRCKASRMRLTRLYNAPFALPRPEPPTLE